MKLYYIKSEKGYWKAGGRGYTDSKAEAGKFTIKDMEDLSLNCCTLYDAD